MASAGDVNGDGYADVIISGERDGASGDPDTGLVWLFVGGPAGLAASPAWTAEGTEGDDRFGGQVTSAGDVNGDGYGDVAIGARDHDTSETDAGAVYVFLGSAKGLSAAADWVLEGDQPSAGFGTSVAGCDVDSDGYHDLLVGWPLADGAVTAGGRVLVYLGSERGLDDRADMSLSNGEGLAQFGSSVACAGDVDRDGFADALVGAYAAGGAGAAFLYRGAIEGLDPEPLWNVQASEPGAMFGWAVAPAGDTDGDGTADLAIGAMGVDVAATDAGQASLYLGSADGTATEPSWTGEGSALNALFGSSIAAAGDVDGDGLDDLLVGAVGDGDGGEGSATLFLGACPADGTDADADGVVACLDCNDAMADIHPGADEHCNGVDDDCDGTVDLDPVEGPWWYPDDDGDGFVDPDAGVRACGPPIGYRRLNEADCDDNDASVGPGAPEVLGDGVDQNCDGIDPPAPAEPDTREKRRKEDGGCGCAASPSGVGAPLAAVALAGIALRRRAPRGARTRRS